MSDDSSAEAVLPILDKWYDRKLAARYDLDVISIIFGRMHRKAKGSMHGARESLWGDFYYTMPSKSGYFSWLYGRSSGFLGSPATNPEDQDTLVLTTLTPVYAMLDKMRVLAERLNKTAAAKSPEAIGDNDIEEVFASSFSSLDEFTDFCMSFLHTRLITADIRSTRGTLSEVSYEMHARNYKAVREGVWVFSKQMVGDILH